MNFKQYRLKLGLTYLILGLIQQPEERHHHNELKRDFHSLSCITPSGSHP